MCDLIYIYIYYIYIYVLFIYIYIYIYIVLALLSLFPVCVLCVRIVRIVLCVLLSVCIHLTHNTTVELFISNLGNHCKCQISKWKTMEVWNEKYRYENGNYHKTNMLNRFHIVLAGISTKKLAWTGNRKQQEEEKG